MAHVVKDRVQETSTTTGTGTFTLDGAVSGFQTFSSAIGNTNTTYYTIQNGAEWEVGIGTVGAGTLSRDTILESSNAGSAVNFSAGTKQVFCTYPAEKSVDLDTAQTLTNKTISGSSNTLSNIGNSSLTNSSITINGTPVSLGGSASVGTVTSVGVTAGTGISVSGSPVTGSGSITVTNTAPDQTVSLTAGSNISITGTYPSFTIAATGGATTAYTRTSFTATSGQTVFSVNYTVGYVEVFVNGVLLNASDYTASNGTSVTLAIGAVTGDIVEFIAYNVATVSTTTANNIAGGSAGAVVYQSGSGATAFTAIGTSGQVLQSNGTSAPSWVDGITASSTTTFTNKTISGASNTITVDGTNEVGFKIIPQNSQSSAYTLVLADSGKHIFHPSADTTARTWTIPANSSVAFPTGTAITFINQNGAGTITISITSDTMRLAGAGTTGNRTLAANGVATAIKVASTEWIISGTGLT